MRLDLDTAFDAFLSDPYAEHPVVNRHILNGGGGGQQTSTQTQTSEAGPPKFLQTYLQNGVNDIVNYYNAHHEAPQYYPGEVVAPLSGVTNQAITGAQNIAGNNPVLPGSIDSLNKFTSGQYVNPETNPDYQAALAYSHQPAIDQFTKQVLPGIQGTFSSAGRYGSGAQQAAVGQAVDSLNRDIAGADATAGSNYYQNALNQQLQANSLVPGLNQSLIANNGALASAGSLIDQNRQAQDAAEQAKYNYNSNAQLNYISQYLAMLNGGYPGGTNTSTGTAMSMQPQNTGGGILGGIMGGAGLALQALPLIPGISDRRVKDNIRKVGETKDGQNLYFFTYKGDATPHVGLMAQEVEQRDPDAVITLPSGVKAVNYPKALGLF